MACDLSTTVLATGRLSRMYRKLVLEKKLASFVAAHNDARQEGGSLLLYAEANQGVEMQALEAALQAEIADFAKAPPSAVEFERAQSILAAGERSETETVTDLAEHVGEYAIDRDWPMAFELTAMRRKLTPEDLQAFAQTYLTPERCVTGTSMPTTQS